MKEINNINYIITMVDVLLNHIARYIQLSASEQQLVSELFHLRRLPKKEFLLQAGDVCRTEHFVVQGCLRAYYIDREAKEHIIQFAVEDWWIGDMRSFVRETPSDFFIEAVESCQLLVIDKPGLERLFREAPPFERFYRIIVQNAFMALQQRVLANLSQTAEERYLEFIGRYPNIEQRVPQHQIAAYLGMSPEFLSRIRRQQAGRS